MTTSSGSKRRKHERVIAAHMDRQTHPHLRARRRVESLEPQGVRCAVSGASVLLYNFCRGGREVGRLRHPQRPVGAAASQGQGLHCVLRYPLVLVQGTADPCSRPIWCRDQAGFIPSSRTRCAPRDPCGHGDNRGSRCYQNTATGQLPPTPSSGALEYHFTYRSGSFSGLLWRPLLASDLEQERPRSGLTMSCRTARTGR